MRINRCASSMAARAGTSPESQSRHEPVTASERLTDEPHDLPQPGVRQRSRNTLALIRQVIRCRDTRQFLIGSFKARPVKRRYVDWLKHRAARGRKAGPGSSGSAAEPCEAAQLELRRVRPSDRRCEAAFQHSSACIVRETPVSCRVETASPELTSTRDADHAGTDHGYFRSSSKPIWLGPIIPTADPLSLRSQSRAGPVRNGTI